MMVTFAWGLKFDTEFYIKLVFRGKAYQHKLLPFKLRFSENTKSVLQNQIISKLLTKHTHRQTYTVCNQLLLTKWLLLQGIFERFDKDRSGKIDSNELRDALLSLGYAVSPTVLDLLVSKFDKTGGKNKAVEYDNFIEYVFAATLFLLLNLKRFWSGVFFSGVL